MKGHKSMKEIKQINAQLTTIKNRWNAEKAISDNKIADVERRIKVAQEALHDAEDPEEYMFAQKTIETTNTELSFYKMQAERNIHSLADLEYKKINADIIKAKHKLIEDTRKELIEDFTKLFAKMYMFEQNMQLITNTSNLLRELSKRPPEMELGNYPALLMDPDIGKRPLDSFSQFCDFYNRKAAQRLI